MNSRSTLVILIVAALVVAGAVYLFGGSDTSTSTQPSPHAIDQNP